MEMEGTKHEYGECYVGMCWLCSETIQVKFPVSSFLGMWPLEKHGVDQSQQGIESCLLNIFSQSDTETT